MRWGELLGKKKDDFTWLSERLNILTENDTFDLINSGDKSLISTFKVGAWTMLKEMALAYYAPNYALILRKQFHIRRLNYLDLFAGSGIVSLDGLSKYYLGSPLVVTKTIRQKLDKYYFFEKDALKTKQLGRLLAGEPCLIKQGDCNDLIDSVLPEINVPGSHSLVFIDPFAMEINFDTIKKFATVGCDLIITVSTQEIFRAIRQWFDNPTWNSNQVDGFFGDQEWRDSLAGIQTDEDIFNYYANRVVKFAFKKKPESTKIEKQLGGQHYFMLFTSTGGRGERPKFFDIIDDFNRRIKNLSGEQITKYLQHYVEGGGTSLRGFFE